MLKYAILGFLGYKPMTGYEIKQRMDRSTTHFWHAKLSHIYTTLKALEKEGAIESNVEEQADRPDRRVYKLTDKGQADLDGWLAQPYTELSPKKETLVLKMFFSSRQERQQVISQLQLQLSLHRKQLDYYRYETQASVQAAVEEFPMLAQYAYMWEATRRFGEMYEETYVRWLEETIDTLQQDLSS